MRDLMMFFGFICAIFLVLLPSGCGSDEEEIENTPTELTLEFSFLPCGDDSTMVGPVPQVVANVVDQIELLFLDTNRRCALKNPPENACPSVKLFADSGYALSAPVELDVPPEGSKTILVELVGKSTRNADNKHIYISGAEETTIFDDPNRAQKISVSVSFEDADKDGFSDYCEDPQGTGRDTDGDGQPDYADSDSDNDGIFDQRDACQLERARIDEDEDGCDDAQDLLPDMPQSFSVRVRPLAQPPTITLNWVAPGDDGDPADCPADRPLAQRVVTYEIVCSDTAITTQNFDGLLGTRQEIPFDGDLDNILDTPQCPGDREILEFTFNDVPGCTEREISYFAIRAIDEFNKHSEIEFFTLSEN